MAIFKTRALINSLLITHFDFALISDGTVDLKVQISVVAVGPINEKDFVSDKTSIFRFRLYCVFFFRVSMNHNNTDEDVFFHINT